MLYKDLITSFIITDVIVKTKSIYQNAEEEDGIRILITRFYPRGIKNTHFDYWIRDLSPSIELLMSYKQGKFNWKDFKFNFLYELKENLNSLEAMHALNFQSKVENITLLCYEKQGHPCHRHLVRDIVENPQSLNTFFESQFAYNHKRSKIPSLISD